MSPHLKFGLTAAVLATLAACAPDYSPNTYNGSAVQQANKVESAVVVGFREVQISANGTVGAVTGGAAGGILGSQMGNTPLQSALGGITGTAVGALVGSTIEHAAGDTTGWEYIVRKHNGDLLSLTQREKTPLPLGQKVLVITGAQARIIPDYSVPPAEPAKEEPPKAPPAVEKPAPLQPIVVVLPAPLAAPTPAATAAQMLPALNGLLPPGTAPITLVAPAPAPAIVPAEPTPVSVEPAPAMAPAEPAPAPVATQAEPPAPPPVVAAPEPVQPPPGDTPPEPKAPAP